MQCYCFPQGRREENEIIDKIRIPDPKRLQYPTINFKIFEYTRGPELRPKGRILKRYPRLSHAKQQWAADVGFDGVL